MRKREQGRPMADRVTGDDDPAWCGGCNGTGEGRADGAICGLCRGSGESTDDDDDDDEGSEQDDPWAHYLQAGRAALAAGEDLDAAIKVAIETYRKNPATGGACSMRIGGGV